MLNRILNSDIPAKQRAEMLGILVATEQNDELPCVLRDLAADFLEYQAQGTD